MKTKKSQKEINAHLRALIQRHNGATKTARLVLGNVDEKTLRNYAQNLSNILHDRALPSMETVEPLVRRFPELRSVEEVFGLVGGDDGYRAKDSRAEKPIPTESAAMQAEILELRRREKEKDELIEYLKEQNRKLTDAITGAVLGGSSFRAVSDGATGEREYVKEAVKKLTERVLNSPHLRTDD